MTCHNFGYPDHHPLLNRQCKLVVTCREQPNSTENDDELIPLENLDPSYPEETTSVINGDKVYACEICGKITKKKGDIIRHIRQSHPDLEDPGSCIK